MRCRSAFLLPILLSIPAQAVRRKLEHDVKVNASRFPLRAQQAGDRLNSSVDGKLAFAQGESRQLKQEAFVLSYGNPQSVSLNATSNERTANASATAWSFIEQAETLVQTRTAISVGRALQYAVFTLSVCFLILIIMSWSATLYKTDGVSGEDHVRTSSSSSKRSWANVRDKVKTMQHQATQQLAVGDQVEVIQAFTSNSEDAVQMRVGDIGTVKEIDSDGDALVGFPGHDDEWIAREDFKKLRKKDIESDEDEGWDRRPRVEKVVTKVASGKVMGRGASGTSSSSTAMFQDEGLHPSMRKMLSQRKSMSGSQSMSRAESMAKAVISFFGNELSDGDDAGEDSDAEVGDGSKSSREEKALKEFEPESGECLEYVRKLSGTYRKLPGSSVVSVLKGLIGAHLQERYFTVRWPRSPRMWPAASLSWWRDQGEFICGKQPLNEIFLRNITAITEQTSKGSVVGLVIHYIGDRTTKQLVITLKSSEECMAFAVSLDALISKVKEVMSLIGATPESGLPSTAGLDIRAKSFG